MNVSSSAAIDEEADHNHDQYDHHRAHDDGESVVGADILHLPEQHIAGRWRRCVGRRGNWFGGPFSTRGLYRVVALSFLLSHGRWSNWGFVFIVVGFS